MDFLPIGINVRNRSIVVIGGGHVAAQKLRTLVLSSARISVAAVTVSDDIRSMPVEWKECAYEPELISGAWLVYACTDDRDVNRRIAADAHERGIPVNVADDPDACDFISPAIWFNPPMSVAVSSDGRDAKRSVAWRNAIREWGGNDQVLR
jgi:precorrin-2 dehydrogenase/sirohydrochlorin ferrochelatase